ncbi:MAG TPA: hypothetical protein VF171_01500 [Trueperaceae bacterium]
MADISRYQRKELYATSGSVRTYHGVDPLTGLPVLIYQFPGRPTAAIGELESENIPGVLASSYDGHEGQVVVAYAGGYAPPREPLAPAEAFRVIHGSARALCDAAQAGIIHGDLNPDRFLVADDHVLVEGYGVRWDESSKEFRPPEYGGEGSFAGDVYSWARSIKALLGGRLPEGLGPLLETCVAPRPESRPAARELYRAIDELARAQDAGGSGMEIGRGFAAGNDDFAGLARAGSAASRPRAEKPTLPPSGPANDAIPDGEEAPRLLKRRTAARSAESSDPGFVRDLPPGATYRAGEELEGLAPGSFREEEAMSFEPPRNNARRLVLLSALLVAAAVLAGLAFWQQGATRLIAPQSRSQTLYIVDVSVTPADMRYVSVVVVESPPGSERAPGDVIGTLVLSDPPESVILDQAGTWRLRARAQDRLSRIVTLEVPRQRSIVFHLPEVTGVTEP